MIFETIKIGDKVQIDSRFKNSGLELRYGDGMMYDHWDEVGTVIGKDTYEGTVYVDFPSQNMFWVGADEINFVEILQNV